MKKKSRQNNLAFLAGIQRIFNLGADFMIARFFGVDYSAIKAIIENGEVSKKIKNKIFSELKSSNDPHLQKEISLFIERWEEYFDLPQKVSAKKEVKFYSEETVSDILGKAMEKAWNSSGFLNKGILLHSLANFLPKANVKLSGNNLYFFDKKNQKRDHFRIPSEITIK